MENLFIEDILLYICPKLFSDDIHPFRLINKQFNKATNQPILWKIFLGKIKKSNIKKGNKSVN